MTNNELTPRERVRLALAHKETDRVPIAYGFGANPPVLRALAEHLGLSGEQAAEDWILGFCDVRKITPKYVGPKLRTFEDGSSEDQWGVVRKPTSYGDGHYDEIVGYPLKDVEQVSDLDNHTWPFVDWWDMTDLSERMALARKDADYALQIGIGNPFESAWYMRGFERMFEDLILNPELAHGILSRVTDFHIAYLTKVLKAADGAIDLVMTADDIGGQTGLLMSLPMWEEFIKPYHVKLNNALHEFDVKVLYHTDGSVMEAVPGLIDMGIDILEALQFDAKGMDPKALKDQFGDKLCFHGGVSVQSTMPFGTAEDVKREVAERIQVLGKNGGYILAPSHTIQAGTPPENVVAMFETARDFRW